MEKGIERQTLDSSNLLSWRKMLLDEMRESQVEVSDGKIEEEKIEAFSDQLNQKIETISTQESDIVSLL